MYSNFVSDIALNLLNVKQTMKLQVEYNCKPMLNN